MVYKKWVLDWSKSWETLVLCSRNIKKLYNLNLYKKSKLTCFHSLISIIFVCENIITCNFNFLGHFSWQWAVTPARSVWLSNNKLSFGPENKKLIKTLLAQECYNYDIKLRNFCYYVPILVSFKKMCIKLCSRNFFFDLVLL